MMTIKDIEKLIHKSMVDMDSYASRLRDVENSIEILQSATIESANSTAEFHIIKFKVECQERPKTNSKWELTETIDSYCLIFKGKNDEKRLFITEKDSCMDIVDLIAESIFNPDWR